MAKVAEFDRQDIFDQIDVEREYQDKIYGAVSDDECNDPSDWVKLITRRSIMYLPGTYMCHSDTMLKEFRSGLVKVAALAVAAIESTDRQLKEEN